MDNRRKEADAEIHASSIGEEAKLCALLALTMDILLHDFDARIRAVYRRHGLIAVENKDGLLKGLHRYSNAYKIACGLYERDIERHIQDATFGFKGVEAYDAFRMAANQFARFAMLLVDRTGMIENNAKIWTYIKRFKSSGRFTDDDIKRLTMD